MKRKPNFKPHKFSPFNSRREKSKAASRAFVFSLRPSRVCRLSAAPSAVAVCRRRSRVGRNIKRNEKVETLPLILFVLLARASRNRLARSSPPSAAAPRFLTGGNSQRSLNEGITGANSPALADEGESGRGNDGVGGALASSPLGPCSRLRRALSSGGAPLFLFFFSAVDRGRGDGTGVFVQQLERRDRRGRLTEAESAVVVAGVVGGRWRLGRDLDLLDNGGVEEPGAAPSSSPVQRRHLQLRRRLRRQHRLRLRRRPRRRRALPEEAEAEEGGRAASCCRCRCCCRCCRLGRARGGGGESGRFAFFVRSALSLEERFHKQQQQQQQQRQQQQRSCRSPPPPRPPRGPAGVEPRPRARPGPPRGALSHGQGQARREPGPAPGGRGEAPGPGPVEQGEEGEQRRRRRRRGRRR